jgi:cellobiose-specific phosphotransferase system component IIC
MADPSHDELTLRVEIFKHASTISSLIATVYITFLLTGLKEKPPAFLFLVISIIAFLVVAFLSVFTLANTASHVAIGNYGLTRQVKISLLIIYIFFFGAFVSTGIFTITNISRFTIKKPQEVPEEIKTYIQKYVSDFNQKSIQYDINNTITKELQILSSRFDENLRKTISEHDKIIKEYIDNKLKEMTFVTPQRSP